MDELNAKIGAVLRKYRKQRKMSMQDVADKLNVTKTAVHYWESGKRSIYADQMLDYCDVIGLDPQQIIKEVLED
jgi:transcriptional regulator with XRE-family HTH domain